MSKLDLAIAYRIYPKVSKPTPVFADDKLKLSELCLKSFRTSLGDLRVKLFALLDGCPPEFESLFKKYFAASDLELTRFSGIGNQATFARQLDILLAQDAADTVYFAEDDYFYLPGQFPSLLSFLNEFPDSDFVSAYDHPDCYSMPIHQGRPSIRLHNDRHWRTAASTCLTFLTRKRTLRQTSAVFASYSRRNLDVALWISLTKAAVFNPVRIWRCFRARPVMAGYVAAAWYYCWRQILFGRRYHLWVPIPALATHMEKAFLAPGVEWNRMFTTLQRGEAKEP